MIATLLCILLMVAVVCGIVFSALQQIRNLSPRTRLWLGIALSAWLSASTLLIYFTIGAPALVEVL